jgi:hypothetical protein
MKSFEIKSSETSSQFIYKNDELIVRGVFTKNTDTQELLSINGTCYANYEGEQGRYIGNFVGELRDGAIKYNFVDTSLADIERIKEAIRDIESEIIPQA